MLVKSPSKLLSRRKALLGAASAVPLFNIIKSRDGRAQSPCGSFAPTIPTYAKNAGFTKLVWEDDYTVAGTIDPTGNATSGFNWFLRGGIGVTISDAAVNTKQTLGGTFASPLGGVLSLTTPVYGGNGNTTIYTTPGSSQRSFNPGFGCWFHGCFELQGQFNPNCNTSGQWWADWFNSQLTVTSQPLTSQQSTNANAVAVQYGLPLPTVTGGTYPLYTELDNFEQFCQNFSYPNTEITTGGHNWLNVTSSNQIDSNGGSLNTTPDGNPHKYAVVWGVGSGSGTGFIQIYIDEVLQTIATSAGNISTIPTGLSSGLAGYEYMEAAGAWFWELGTPPGFDFLIDYTRVWQ
jgi:hypothetical protein